MQAALSFQKFRKFKKENQVYLSNISGIFRKFGIFFLFSNKIKAY
jgi:hypothetical protein